MKYLMIYLTFFMASCGSANKDKALEGVYTASFEHEFGITDDTLILEKANNGNGIYQIHKRAGVIKKLNGRKFPKELLTETWILDYDADKQILTELKRGRILIWNKEKQALNLGEIQYKKVGD